MKKYLISILLPLNTFAQIVITNGLTHQFQTANGQITGIIKLKNSGKNPETFISSKYEIIFNCGNYASFSDKETHDRSLNNWLEFDVDEKTLSPNQEFDLVFRISIPDDVMSGTYWSAVMIEHGDLIGSNTALNVQSKARYAVQIIVNKGSFEAPKLIYKKVNISSYGKDSKIVRVELENTGFYSVIVKTQLELYDEKGIKVQTVKGDVKNIYPSRCNIYDIVVKNLRPGKYDGVVMSDTGKKIYASNISFKIE
jgi:hypothetical protein